LVAYNQTKQMSGRAVGDWTVGGGWGSKHTPLSQAKGWERGGMQQSRKEMESQGEKSRVRRFGEKKRGQGNNKRYKGNRRA